MTIAEHLRAEALRASIRAASALESAGPCGFCGKPMVRGASRVPPKFHPACRRFRFFLAAALRALDELDPATRALARRRLIAAANRLPANHARPRGPSGRFLPTRPSSLTAPGVGPSAGAGAEGCAS